MNKEELVKVFTDYVFDNYDINDNSISKKYYHSLRVTDICEELAINNNLSQGDIYLSIVIGVLHDYGRFYQWKKYKTYIDSESIDHADLAIELLFDNNEIEKFNLNKDYYYLIQNSIKYHNKMFVADKMSSHNKLWCKLIRDADKLDIISLCTTDDFLNKLDDNPISEEVRKDFYNNKQIDRNFLKYGNDYLILYLGFIFDLNFDYSYKYIKSKKLLEKIYNKLKYKEMFKEYFDYINNFIDERIG